MKTMKAYSYLLKIQSRIVGGSNFINVQVGQAIYYKK